MDDKLVGKISKFNISNAFKAVDSFGNFLNYRFRISVGFSANFHLFCVDASFAHKDNLPDRSFLRLSNGVRLSSTSFMLNKALSMTGLIREKFSSAL